MNDIRGKEDANELDVNDNIEMEFQRGFTDGEFLIDDYIKEPMPEQKQQLDIHDLVDLDIEDTGNLPVSKLESPCEPKLLTNDNPLESQIQANNSFIPDLTLEDIEGENSFQTSDNQTLIETLFKFTSKNKNANDAVKKLQKVLEFES